MTAKKKKYKPAELDPKTMIEVVATKGKNVVKLQMTVAEAKKLKKKTGWNYSNYQLGFCSMKENNINNLKQ